MIETEVTFLKISRVVQIPKITLRGSQLPIGSTALRDAQHRLSIDAQQKLVNISIIFLTN